MRLIGVGLELVSVDMLLLEEFEIYWVLQQRSLFSQSFLLVFIVIELAR